MKKTINTGFFILCIALFYGTPVKVVAQDSVVAEPSVNLRYFANNNRIQYLLVQSRLKIGKKIQSLPHRKVQVYLDSISPENLITKTTTDEKGLAKVIIPVSLKEKWNSSPQHTFVGILESTSKEEEKTTSLEIIRSKIEMDTSTRDSVHSINVQVKFFQNNEWVPAKDVEMKIGVARSASILSGGDEETYTTDSTGVVSAEFKRDNLPGDQQGNFMLVAKVEDNDQYGNLLIEKTVPWGIITKPETNFFEQRTLWSTRFRTPLWLLFMAYSIVITVWGVLIYLVFQIIKIKKLGTETKEKEKVDGPFLPV